MPVQTKDSLYPKFDTGQKPPGEDFRDLIDSAQEPLLQGANITLTPQSDGTTQISATVPSSLPPSGSAGGNLTGTYPNPTIANGAVTTARLADSSITTAKIGDNQVTTAKVVDSAITTIKIADNNITQAKIATAVRIANPNSITFTGAASGTYDGSSALTVDIPTGGGGGGATLTFQGGATGTYDGSSPVTITIPTPPDPSTAIPLASARTGVTGTSVLYAREGHRHPFESFSIVYVEDYINSANLSPRTILYGLSRPASSNLEISLDVSSLGWQNGDQSVIMIQGLGTVTPQSSNTIYIEENYGSVVAESATDLTVLTVLFLSNYFIINKAIYKSIT